jgi:hypothetical protein
MAVISLTFLAILSVGLPDSSLALTQMGNYLCPALDRY